MRRAAPPLVVACLVLACGDGSAPAASGGAGGVGETSSSSSIGVGPGPVSVSASSSSTVAGAGGANPDDPFGCLQGPPPGRPASIPEGYFPWACWSQKPQCMIWVPTDPGAVIAPVEWEACTAGSPGGDGCRQMTRPWRRDGIGEVGEGFPAVPKLGVLDGELVMKFPRVYVDGTSSSYAEFVVAPVDGSPVRLGFRRGYYPDAGCGYQDRDFTEEFWVLGATGQDDVPISDSPEDGLVLIDVAAGTFSLPFKDDTPRDHSWYVSSQAVLRGSGPVLTVHDHQFTQEVVVHDAADDPFGAGPANVRTVLGDAAFWDVATDDTVGIRSYDPILGPQDFVRYLDDRSRGAGGLGTDGIDLVWTEGEGRSPGDVTYPVRSIVTSPYTTDPEALVPRRLRADPTTSFGVDSVKFRVGCGRAGKSEGATPKDIQIVDLEDGTAWFMNHTQQLWHGGTVLGLTCDEIFLTASVWVDGEPQGSVIQRIRFDALGEPIPPD